ncbi:Uncharacterised protein [Klebsiella pneumoniae]|nr:Uncharacterised protein [Klebsiella pneumoniae]
MLVDPAQVQRPGRHHQGHPFQRPAGGDQPIGGGDDELGKLRRAVRADPFQLVGDGAVGEALDQAVLVAFQVDPRYRCQQRGHVAVHEGPHVAAQQRVAEGLVDEAVAAQEAQVGERQVAAVEQADLHLLVGRDVVGELHADLFPGRAPSAETIFQHPLHEGFADHRPGVFHVVPLGQLAAVGGAGHRGDAVDHGVGKADVRRDPARQPRVEPFGEGQQRLARHLAVMREVVAGHHGERRHACVAAPPQSLAEKAEDPARGPRVGQVVAHQRQLGEELAAAIVDAVAAFGDGQRDDADGRLGKFFQQRLGAVLGEQHAADGADHADLGVRLVAQLVEGVEVVLGGQGVVHGAVVAAQAGAADRPVEGFAAVHQGVGVGRLVRAVEAADADVDDALAQLRGVVGRAGDSGRQQGEVLPVEFHRWVPAGGFRPPVAVVCRGPGRCCRTGGSAPDRSPAPGGRRSPVRNRRARAG